MCEELIFAAGDDTLVCDECGPHHRLNPYSDAFLSLIRHQIERDRRSQSDFASLLGISRRKLGRILCGERPLLLAELRTLTDLLKIDRARATVAIEVIGDWQSYDDPGLCIFMRLVKLVVTKLEDRADFTLEPLTEAAEEKLSNWLVDTIIANAEQIRHRRNDFIQPPRL
jgi:transcriptional regulator with XRE-family HTH domain